MRETPVRETPVRELLGQSCGISGTTRSERAGCERNGQCTLSDVDYRSCHTDDCGHSQHAYNCAFATRLAAYCREHSSCDDVTSDIELGCGSGFSPPLQAICEGGFCQTRIRPPTPRSRLIRVTGALEKRAVVQSVRRELRHIESCFPTRIDERNDSAGALVFNIVVSSTGTVESTAVVNRSDADAMLVECISRAIRSVEFPASTDGQPAQLLHRFAPPP